MNSDLAQYKEQHWGLEWSILVEGTIWRHASLFAFCKPRDAISDIFIRRGNLDSRVKVKLEELKNIQNLVHANDKKKLKKC